MMTRTTKKIEDLEFEKICSYDPYNKKADHYGNVYSWVARDFPNTIAYGNTKKECISEARRYLRRINKKEEVI